MVGQCSRLSLETCHNAGRLLKPCKIHWIVMLNSDYIAQLVNGSDLLCAVQVAGVFVAWFRTRGTSDKPVFVGTRCKSIT